MLVVCPRPLPEPVARAPCSLVEAEASRAPEDGTRRDLGTVMEAATGRTVLPAVGNSRIPCVRLTSRTPCGQKWAFFFPQEHDN